MLFNSLEFIFIFLPFVFLIYFLLNKFRWINAAKVWLFVSSLFFYSWWNVIYLPLILTSMLVNYAISIILRREYPELNRKSVLIIGIGFNVGLLGYFKYADFFISNINEVFTANIFLLNLALPLAISFYTFQQIAFLVDTYRWETKKYIFFDYALFVTFFPQLIAGPIVYHKELIPQMESLRNKKINYKNILIGIFVFSIGLFKKVVIADSFAVWANRGFDELQTLTFIEGWVASLSYTFQLYFDFSGYTDMAIGAALLFNIKLPTNFNSPYKSINIQDFWKRWHMTLSGFLTRYIYIPLGGNRKGNIRLYTNILIVFLISGLWHGAGWTFIFWGFLHGMATVVNRYWQTFHIKMNILLAWFITFNFINASWVFFRAKTWSDAWKVLSAMFGLNGIQLPAGMNYIALPVSGEAAIEMYIYLTLGFISVLLLNNSNQFRENFKPKLQYALYAAILFFYGVSTAFTFKETSEFLYFNF
jgi:alginate O-acetyltransferase complex protein AlgI